MGPLSMEQALGEEGARLASPGLETFAENLRQTAERQDSERARTYKNADARDGKDESPDEPERRKTFYRSLNKLNRSALCLSGGSIRSATFCLGVIQGLAAYDIGLGRPAMTKNAPWRRRPPCSGDFNFYQPCQGAAISDLGCPRGDVTRTSPRYLAT